MAKYKKMMPPRNTVIRGQDHLLAYITPEEAALLKARGGSGEAGPMGIPAFAEEDGDDDDVAGSVGGGIGGDDVGTAGGPDGGSNDGGGFAGYSGDDVEASYGTSDADISGYESGTSTSGMSPGRSQAQFGTTEFAGLTEAQAQGLIGSGQASQQAMAVQASLANQKAAEIAALQQLNIDLYDLSRREQRAKSLPGILGLIAAKNVRNLAASMAGYPPGFLSGINVFSGNTIGPGLDPSSLAGLQSRGIRGATGKDPFGRSTTGIVGFRDAAGNLAYGRDPNEDATVGGDGYDEQTQVRPVNPVTGQCDAGYIFDEDLQACRLDTSGARPSGAGSVVPPADGAYARMGLLDVAPTGLPQFQQQYGAGFGTPQDFAAANLNFRRQGATYPEYFQRPPQLSGYTLLS